jgi:hypothetical protein
MIGTVPSSSTRKVRKGPISSASFIRAYRSHDKLRTIVNRQHAMFIAEGRQSTACNAVHIATDRLCRWLANAQDQSGMDDLELRRNSLPGWWEFSGRRSTSFAAFCTPKGSSTPAAAISGYRTGGSAERRVRVLRHPPQTLRKVIPGLAAR